MADSNCFKGEIMVGGEFNVEFIKKFISASLIDMNGHEKYVLEQLLDIPNNESLILNYDKLKYESFRKIEETCVEHNMSFDRNSSSHDLKVSERIVFIGDDNKMGQKVKLDESGPSLQLFSSDQGLFYYTSQKDEISQWLLSSAKKLTKENNMSATITKDGVEYVNKYLDHITKEKDMSNHVFYGAITIGGQFNKTIVKNIISAAIHDLKGSEKFILQKLKRIRTLGFFILEDENLPNGQFKAIEEFCIDNDIYFDRESEDVYGRKKRIVFDGTIRQITIDSDGEPILELDTIQEVLSNASNQQEIIDYLLKWSKQLKNFDHLRSTITDNAINYIDEYLHELENT